MLRVAIGFLVIALIAAFLGFTGIGAGAAGIAKVLFFIFIILAIGSFFFGRGRRLTGSKVQTKPSAAPHSSPPH